MQVRIEDVSSGTEKTKPENSEKIAALRPEQKSQMSIKLSLHNYNLRSQKIFEIYSCAPKERLDHFLLP